MNISSLSPYVLGVILLLSVFGCSVKESPPLLLEQRSYRVLLITPQMRFHDTGFVKRYTDRTELELYALGRSLYKILVRSQQICLQQQCYPKVILMYSLFGEDAYADLLEDILLQRDIYEGQNLSFRETAQGLETIQAFQTQQSSILYVRRKDYMSFSDSKKRIKIIFQPTS